MPLMFLFYIAVFIYACIRFGVNAVYAEKGELVSASVAVFDAIVLFLVSASAIVIIFKIPL